MKAFYDKYLRISDNEKISDKVLIFRIILSVTIILLCLLCMTIMSYAYYSFDLSVRSNSIKSAGFDVDVIISYTDNDSQVHHDKLTRANGGYYTASLEKDIDYTVSISKAQAATAETGFCVLRSSVPGSKSFHTVQIGYDSALTAPRNNLSFTVRTSESLSLEITPHWGTSSYYDDYISGNVNPIYITEGGSVTLP